MCRRVRLVFLCLSLWMVNPAFGSEWRYYGGDPGSGKYSPLDQIHEGNVRELEVAWTWQAPDSDLVKADGKLAFFGFKSSPIMIDDTLYISTPLGFVVALEADTGHERCRFDTQSRKAGPSGTPITFESGGRQFISLTVGGSRDARLIALALPNNDRNHRIR